MERYETEIVVGIKADSYDEAVNEIVKKLNEIDGVYLIICDDTELEDDE